MIDLGDFEESALSTTGMALFVLLCLSFAFGGSMGIPDWKLNLLVGTTVSGLTPLKLLLPLFKLLFIYRVGSIYA